MKSSQLSLYTLHQDEPLPKAVWKSGAVFGRTLFVVDDLGRLVGVLPHSQIPGYYVFAERDLCSITTGGHCLRDYPRIDSDHDPYLYGCRFFADNPQIAVLPVVDGDGVLVDLFFRYQAFYKEYLFSSLRPWPDLPLLLPRLHYGRLMWNAAKEAESLGYGSISVMEFGVAMGHGLISCETHAKEIERFFNVKIEIYGFDSGAGLPKSQDYRDIPFLFEEGNYAMDPGLLRSRLERAELILGDIRRTAPEFLVERNPASVGVMLVDVDYYSSTVPILAMLERDDRHFLPRVQMYFDDVECCTEYTGELAAIDEFNRRNEAVKICPASRGGDEKLQVCHRYRHPKYNQCIYEKPAVALDR